MSGRQWSTEMFTCQFKELQATTLCLSRDGRLGLLASRRHLALLDMEEPQEVVRKVARSSRWEVGAAGWNPHPQYSSYVALCCSDKLELFTCDTSAEFVSEQAVRGHTRQVTDIHWSCTEPSLLASAGLDGNTHVWDIRDMRRPCQTYNTIVGAGHVRWSRDGQFLATAHEGDVKLWDARGDTCSPLSCVSVHMSRVHSVDWSYTHPDTLVTASNDCTVKFHTVAASKQVQTSTRHDNLSTSVPVWTARHTPFGDGLVTVLVPHFGAHDHSLFLWNNNNLSTPVHTFVGHKDVILDFEWRKCGTGSLDYQMVTWSRDQTLRMWNVDTDAQYRCGVDEDDLESLSNSSNGEDSDDQEDATEAVEAIYLNIDAKQEQKNNENIVHHVKKDPLIVKITESPVKEHSPESTLENTLQQEFALLETNLNFVQIVDRDLERRACRVIANTGHSRLLISITFPTSYPVNTAPMFTFLKGSTLIQQNRTKILKMLQDTAITQVRKNRACLEICLRQLEVMLDQINQEEIADEEATKTNFPFVRPPDPHQTTNNFGMFQDTIVPYPRTSGSRFCSNGLLVCFGRPTFQIKVSNDKPESSQTPRTYSAYLSSVGGANASSEQDLIKFGQIASGSRFPALPNIHHQGGHEHIGIDNLGNIDDGHKDGGSLTNLTVTGQNFVDNSNKDQSYQSTIKKGRFKVKRVASGAQEDGFLKMRRNVGKPAKPKQHHHYSISPSPPLKVTVYDISAMLPVSRDLAEHYIVDNNPHLMCERNHAVAVEFGNMELAQIWQMVGQVLIAAKELGDSPETGPWSFCPLGKPLISSLIRHHVDCNDFQTVAMLVCALTSQTKLKKKAVIENAQEPEQTKEKDKFWFLKSGAGLMTSQGDSPYHTVHSVHTTITAGPGLRSNGGSETKLDSLFVKKNTRSNSWTEVGQDDTNSMENDDCDGVPHGEARYGLLDLNETDLYKSAISAYCELLYNWRLLKQRTEVSKHGPAPRDEDTSDTCIGSLCDTCSEPVSGRTCATCNTTSLTCVICRVPVSGLSLVCPGCGHGGHYHHLRQWYSQNDHCPANCPCQCKMYY